MVTLRNLISAQSTISSGVFDLPRLACDAALSLDNLLNGEPPLLSDIRRLAEVLTKETSISENQGTLLLNPSTVMVMCRAIDDAGEPNESLTHVTDVVEHTDKIARALEDIANAPNSSSEGDITRLRNYCLALSERSSASEQSLDEWESKHPWRR